MRVREEVADAAAAASLKLSCWKEVKVEPSSPGANWWIERFCHGWNRKGSRLRAYSSDILLPISWYGKRHKIRRSFS